jgi:hypothetical protein
MAMFKKIKVQRTENPREGREKLDGQWTINSSRHLMKGVLLTRGTHYTRVAERGEGKKQADKTEPNQANTIRSSAFWKAQQVDPEFMVDKDHDPATKKIKQEVNCPDENCRGAKPPAASSTGSHRSMHRDTRIRQTGSQQVVTQQAAPKGGRDMLPRQDKHHCFKGRTPFLYNATQH